MNCSYRIALTGLPQAAACRKIQSVKIAIKPALCVSKMSYYTREQALEMVLQDVMVSGGEIDTEEDPDFPLPHSSDSDEPWGQFRFSEAFP